jgi:hypothetical protein
VIEIIVNSINQNIEALYPDKDVETYGIARIHDLNTEKYPAVFDLSTESWCKIYLNCEFELTAYHRVLGITELEDSEDDFRTFHTQSLGKEYEMVLVLCFTKDYDYSEAVKVANAIIGEYIYSGYHLAYVELDSIESDEDQIINDEFGKIDYTKYKSTHNIFKVFYNATIKDC